MASAMPRETPRPPATASSCAGSAASTASADPKRSMSIRQSRAPIPGAHASRSLARIRSWAGCPDDETGVGGGEPSFVFPAVGRVTA
ncbi:MAG: hypothetical protein EBS51_09355 [Planctomycetia bacterium]|nr:hypothetical protein [Planctomycetia bacterium]